MGDENAPAPDAVDEAADVDGTAAETVGSLTETPSGESAAVDVLSTFSTQEWAQELVRDQEENAPYVVGQAEIDNLPIEAKRVLAALALRGKQANAQLETQLADLKARGEAAEAKERSAIQIQADALSWVNSPGVAAYIEGVKPKGDQPDPDTEEGVQWLADKRVSEQLQGFFDVLKQTSTDRDAAAATSKQAAVRSSRETEVGAYMDKHAADFAHPETYTQIRALCARGLSVEEAHEFVTARLAVADLKKNNTAAVDEARARVVRGGTTVRRVPDLPKEIRGDTEAEAAWYDAHPDALKRDLERHERGTARR
jgi:hypothetical protein